MNLLKLGSRDGIWRKKSKSDEKRVQNHPKMERDASRAQDMKKTRRKCSESCSWSKCVAQVWWCFALEQQKPNEAGNTKGAAHRTIGAAHIQVARVRRTRSHVRRTFAVDWNPNLGISIYSRHFFPKTSSDIIWYSFIVLGRSEADFSVLIHFFCIS